MLDSRLRGNDKKQIFNHWCAFFFEIDLTSLWLWSFLCWSVRVRAPLFGFCRVVVRVFCWHFGFDRSSPGGELFLQLAGFLRHFFGEVVLLSDIVLQVVQFDAVVVEELY